MASDYTELRTRVAGLPVRRCAVPGAADEHALDAVFTARREGYAEPVLVGDPREIRTVMAGLSLADEPATIVGCPPDRNPAEVAVALVRGGEADFILKGRLTTRDLLRPILDKTTGLNDEGFVTHLGVMQLASYHKLLALSDSAVIPYPTLQDKRRIVTACTAALRRLGLERPVIAALCGIEDVNPRMPETVDAAELVRLAEAGEFGDAVVVGPISYDVATSRQAAAIKRYPSVYAGDVDMLLVPHLVTGNVMSKIWNADPANLLGGCLIGTRVPVALTSRSAAMPEKLASILLCALLSGEAEAPRSTNNESEIST